MIRTVEEFVSAFKAARMQVGTPLGRRGRHSDLAHQADLPHVLLTTPGVLGAPVAQPLGRRVRIAGAQFRCERAMARPPAFVQPLAPWPAPH